MGSLCSRFYDNGLQSFSRAHRGLQIIVYLEMKDDREFNIPIRHLTPSLSNGSGISSIALILALSGRIPSLDNMSARVKRIRRFQLCFSFVEFHALTTSTI